MIISELAGAFEIRPSALRFYERIGILSPAGRVSGRRQYDEGAKRRVSLILSARESGFTLKEIKELISAASKGTPPRRLWRDAAAVKRIRLHMEIQRLQSAEQSLEQKAACRCKTLRDCEKLLARRRCAP
jgi:MerR family redox-sensitive transcriptional activator SoxR